MIVTACEASSTVAVVKETVTDLPEELGRRSAAAIVRDTPETWPPIEPESTPSLTRSLLVLTVMPFLLPDVGEPMVKPTSVITAGEPAAKIAPEGTVNTMKDGPVVTEERAPLVDMTDSAGPAKKNPMG